MNLWTQWYGIVETFQWACSRKRTFYFLVLVLVGFTIRPEFLGVTSFIRALGIDPLLYKGFLHFFNYSKALDLLKLTQIWHALVVSRFPLLQIGPYRTYVVDGIKIPKEGKKMPGVKKLYQPSENNSKPAYIRGHSFQAISILAGSPENGIASIPLISRIQEGVLSTPRDQRSQLDRMAKMFLDLVSSIPNPALLVADAYYASQSVIRPLLLMGHQLISRLRTNSVAYYPAVPSQKPKRGRPAQYGNKVLLRQFFDTMQDQFIKVPSPVYGEEDVTISYYTMNLLWRPIGKLVRFVWVIHPTRGRAMFLCTDLNLDPVVIIRAYGYRFKIEVGFRQALYQIGSYAYHFWMRDMKPRKRNSGTQYLHKESKSYRKMVERKMEAYHRFVQLGCIAQGMMQYMSLVHGQEVWAQFRSWLRTMKKNQAPSELVVMYAMREGLLEFLSNSPEEDNLKKILLENMRLPEAKAYHIAA